MPQTEEQKTPSFHSQMMNLSCVPRGTPRDRESYKFGHRDARHTAAEVALVADTTIAELRAENRKLRDAAFLVLSNRENMGGGYFRVTAERLGKLADAIREGTGHE